MTALWFYTAMSVSLFGAQWVSAAEVVWMCGPGRLHTVSPVLSKSW